MKRAARAADLNQRDDPQNGYASDVLSGPREGEARLLIERYCGSALLIRSFDSPSRLLQEYPQIAGMIRHLKMVPSEAARRIIDLTRRHAEDVHQALAAAVAQYASEITAKTLPTTCMLSIACSRQVGPSRTSSHDDPPPATNGHPGHSLEIRHDRFEIGIGAKTCYLKDTLEFYLIAFLAERIGEFATIQKISDEVWDDEIAKKNSVQRVVSSLRRKLKDAGMTELTLDGSQNGLYRLLFEPINTNISAASVRTQAPHQ